MWNLLAIQAPAAWRALGWPQRRLEQHRVLVAVIDTGVDTQYPDPQGRVAPWRRNFADAVATDDVAADSVHGTAMASIVAATGHNGTGIDGIMWGAQVIACKMGGGYIR